MLRQDTHYRSDAFSAGLKKLGYEVRATDTGVKVGPQSLLVLWNRKTGREDRLATAWERCGAKVLIAENGYIGKDANGHQYYAMAMNGHNGSGRWHIGDEDRLAKLGIELKPWQNNSGHILICGQRGIGSPSMASPPAWHIEVLKHLKKRGSPYELRLRNHPGNNAPQVPLEKDLTGASGCLVWSSSSGVRALAMGIPVCYAAPHWVCARAAVRFNDKEWIAAFLRDDAKRLEAMRRMAYAQWTLNEIASGEAFDALLNRELNS